VTERQCVSEPRVDRDIASGFVWYERQQAGLGHDFIDELLATYDRIVDGPFRYHDLGCGIHRALLRRFPYAVYYAVDRDVIVVLAVLHASRDATRRSGGDRRFGLAIISSSAVYGCAATTV